MDIFADTDIAPLARPFFDQVALLLERNIGTSLSKLLAANFSGCLYLLTSHSFSNSSMLQSHWAKRELDSFALLWKLLSPQEQAFHLDEFILVFRAKSLAPEDSLCFSAGELFPMERDQLIPTRHVPSLSLESENNTGVESRFLSWLCHFPQWEEKYIFSSIEEYLCTAIIASCKWFLTEKPGDFESTMKVHLPYSRCLGSHRPSRALSFLY